MPSTYLPQELLNSLVGIKGFDSEKFIQTHENDPTVSAVRLNQTKITDTSRLFAGQECTVQKVPWCPIGLYVEPRPFFTFDPLLHAGAYYVQDASSMFLWEVLKQHAKFNDVKVLDSCAAPGGKTTLLSSFFMEGLVVANEVIKSRVNILLENGFKWGAENIVVTNNDVEDFAKLKGYFDVIVTDAPCSGSGLFRKDKNAVQEWSPANVALCSMRQQRILTDLMPSLKEEGLFIYATCSYSAEENEDIADFIMDKFNCTSLPVKLQQEWNIVEVQSKNHGAYGYRFFPDKVKGEGFFIAVFKKHDGIDEKYTIKYYGEKLSAKDRQIASTVLTDKKEYALTKFNNQVITISPAFSDDIALLKQHLRLRKSGILVGEIKGNELIPNHQLALSSLINESLPIMKLNLNQAIRYLRKDDLHLQECTNAQGMDDSKISRY